MVSDKEILTVVKEAGLGPSDLENLYLELGMDKPAIENATLSKKDLGYKLQAIEVLRTWRRNKGRSATKGEILGALRRCKNLEAVAKLEDLWGFIPSYEGNFKIQFHYLASIQITVSTWHERKIYCYTFDM